MGVNTSEKKGIRNYISNLSSDPLENFDKHYESKEVREMREQIERHGLPKGHMPKRGKPYEGALNNSPGSDHVPIKQSAGKRPPRSANLNADQRDKIYELERENMDLKQKENYLENNIVIMRTKLRRIEELFSKKKKD